MALPTLTYSVLNGKRRVSISGSVLFPSDKTAAPAGTHDLKTVNGNKSISIAGNLHEPLDIATALGKL